MQEGTVFFEGREVPVRGFRAFVYGKNGVKKVANSWIEYQGHLATGFWFSSEIPPTVETIEEPKVEAITLELKAKPKRKKGRA